MAPLLAPNVHCLTAATRTEWGLSHVINPREPDKPGRKTLCPQCPRLTAPKEKCGSQGGSWNRAVGDRTGPTTRHAGEEQCHDASR
ncbi:hypothetical protein BKA56DRAFT_584591 [Ilyonectria sp. MPI-CAGE-AT-0026]|nr:hypothetical protein BKA56DRAFT_584591 [Ilyonectria sp. MPI-CAGE-AT-0026]